MRELRVCPVEGTAVLLNDAWIDRPAASRAPGGGACRWCAPPRRPIATAPGLVGPAVYAVPHPTPALGVEGDARVRREGGRVWRDAVGAHEVVYGAHAGDDRACLALVRARIEDLRQDTRLRGFRVSRRAGPGRHAAWQVFALPYELPLSAPARWRDDELADGGRVITHVPGAAAILAWAPRTPLETWVLPDAGRAAFADADPGPVAALVAETLTRLSRALRDPVIDAVILDGEPWRIELRPRATPGRPVEVATGMPVHGAFPERAAEMLRSGQGAAS